MQLVFLHGAPAAGKLTVAQELAAFTGARLSDNHISIDLALSIMKFGDPGFWDLVVEARLATYRIAARVGMPLLITTNAYDHPADLPHFEAYEAVVEAEGGCVLPVFLSCPVPILMERVEATSRRARRKIATQKGLRAYLDDNNFAPVPRDNCLTLDTSQLSPRESAAEIARHFGLPALQGKT